MAKKTEKTEKAEARDSGDAPSPKKTVSSSKKSSTISDRAQEQLAQESWPKSKRKVRKEGDGA